MSHREVRRAPAPLGVGQKPAKAKLRLVAGTGRKRRRRSRMGQDLWDETGWSDQRWSRAAPSPRWVRARSLARGRGAASPKNAARERSRVGTLSPAFLALQAALPAVPPDTKLSRLDVLVLAAGYIAHLTRTLGHEVPGPARPPFLRGLHCLHPLRRWPMRSCLYAGGLRNSGFDSAAATTSSRRTEAGPQVSEEADTLFPTRPRSLAVGDK